MYYVNLPCINITREIYECCMVLTSIFDISELLKVLSELSFGGVSAQTTYKYFSRKMPVLS